MIIFSWRAFDFSVFGSYDGMMTWCFDTSLSVTKLSRISAMTGVRAVTPTRMWRPELNSELNTLTQLSDGPTMRPIRSQYPGHMITLDQSEATIRHVENPLCGLKMICSAFAHHLRRKTLIVQPGFVLGHFLMNKDLEWNKTLCVCWITPWLTITNSSNMQKDANEGRWIVDIPGQDVDSDECDDVTVTAEHRECWMLIFMARSCLETAPHFLLPQGRLWVWEMREDLLLLNSS